MTNILSNIKSIIHTPFRGLGGLLLLVLAGCSNDVDTPTLPDARPIGVGVGTQVSFEAGRLSRGGDTSVSPGSPASRANEPDDITDEQSEKTFLPDVMGVMCTTDIRETPILFNNTRIFYNKEGDTYKNLPDDYDWQWPAGFAWPATEQWPYPSIQYWHSSWSLEDTDPNKKNYQFYAYAPHSSYNEGMTIEMTDMTFGSMNSFAMGKIPPLSSQNYMISRKIEERKSGKRPVFDMLNLSARICMRLKIGEQYNRIRKIRIREITVNDRTENSAVYYKCQYKINAPDTDPDKLTFSADGTYVPAGPNAVIPVIPIFKNEEGLLLTTKFQQFGSLYCMPQELQNITMNVTYDVYDLTPDERDPNTGLLVNEPIRPNQKATNNVTIGLNVKSGYYYNVNIVVSPDYLYVLSDNDVVPDLVISPEE